MIEMIHAHAEKCGGEAEYTPIREVIEAIDRLVDIYNNTGMSTVVFTKDVK